MTAQGEQFVAVLHDGAQLVLPPLPDGAVGWRIYGAGDVLMAELRAPSRSRWARVRFRLRWIWAGQPWR